MKLPPNTIIASGPVIIEKGKVLLNREQKETGITPWFFPGGQVENFDITLETSCLRETKEEMGLTVEIIRPLRTLLLRKPDGEGLVILVHFLARRSGEIVKGENVVAYDWFDIKSLPENTAENVKVIIQDYLDHNFCMKKLYRSKINKMLGGVLGGVAEYFEVDSTVIRLGYVVLAIFTGVVPLVILYFLAAIIVPIQK